MKKLFTLIAATILCVGAQAQSVNINLKNGTTVYYSGNEVEYVDFNETQEVPSGLKVVTIGNYIWAETNLGADVDHPEQPGRYFRWGEKKEYKNTQTNQTYYGYYIDDIARSLETGSPIQFFENDYTSPSSYFDPVTAEWKSPWETPTVAAFNNLIDNTTQRWGSLNSISGIWFEKTPGDSLLFFPAVQCCHEGVIATQEPYDGAVGEFGHFGCYWTKDSKDTKRACGFFFGSEEPVFEKRIDKNEITNRMENTEYKWYALPIRPCRKK